jgi:hypothetical protein
MTKNTGANLMPLQQIDVYHRVAVRELSDFVAKSGGPENLSI